MERGFFSFVTGPSSAFMAALVSTSISAPVSGIAWVTEHGEAGAEGGGSGDVIEDTVGLFAARLFALAACWRALAAPLPMGDERKRAAGEAETKKCCNQFM